MFFSLLQDVGINANNSYEYNMMIDVYNNNNIILNLHLPKINSLCRKVKYFAYIFESIPIFLFEPRMGEKIRVTMLDLGLNSKLLCGIHTNGNW